MTKQEIMDKLTEAGIDFDPTARVADLKALLPKLPKDKEATGGGGGVDEEPSIKVELDDASATIYGKAGEVIRVYTLGDHGENFAELAEEYATKLSNK